MAPVLQLLHETTEDGIDGRELPVSQASLFVSLVESIFGKGNLSDNMISISVDIGIVIYLIDLFLKSKKSSIRLQLNAGCG